MYQNVSFIGNLAEKFGPKWIFGGGILTAGILTLLAPTAARIDYRALVAVRILTGMASGPAFPSAAALWGKWVMNSSIGKTIHLLLLFL